MGEETAELKYLTEGVPHQFGFRISDPLPAPLLKRKDCWRRTWSKPRVCRLAVLCSFNHRFGMQEHENATRIT